MVNGEKVACIVPSAGSHQCRHKLLEWLGMQVQYPSVKFSLHLPGGPQMTSIPWRSQAVFTSSKDAR